VSLSLLPFQLICHVWLYTLPALLWVQIPGFRDLGFKLKGVSLCCASGFPTLCLSQNNISLISRLAGFIQEVVMW